MRPVRAVFTYLAFVFLVGALIAPWVYSLMQVAAASWPYLGSIASKPFPRYVNRSLLILALVGLVPFLRNAELLSWRGIGLGKRPDAMSQMGWGFILGLISLAGVVLIVLTAGVRTAVQEFGTLALLGRLARTALTAGLVAALEEVVFRGAVFGALRKSFHWPFALLMSSALYALLHFLERPEPVAEVNWMSGLAVLGSMVAGFSDLEKLIPGFLTLTLVGTILGLAYQRSGSLYFSIGLHAGWIFWLKTYGFLTHEAVGKNISFYGTGKLINGWLAFLVLAAVLVVLSRTLRQDEPQTGWKERRLFS